MGKLSEQELVEGRTPTIDKLKPIRCGGCLNVFWVRLGPEFMPKACCYCAREFDYTRGIEQWDQDTGEPRPD